MVAHPPFGSPSYKLVAKGLVDLYLLIKDGKDDSREAESVRDALDAPLKALNQTEKERAQWLSEDLFSVSEPPAATTQKELNPKLSSNSTRPLRHGRAENGIGPWRYFGEGGSTARSVY